MEKTYRVMLKETTRNVGLIVHDEATGVWRYTLTDSGFKGVLDSIGNRGYAYQTPLQKLESAQTSQGGIEMWIGARHYRVRAIDAGFMAAVENEVSWKVPISITPVEGEGCEQRVAGEACCSGGAPGLLSA